MHLGDSSTQRKKWWILSEFILMVRQALFFPGLTHLSDLLFEYELSSLILNAKNFNLASFLQKNATIVDILVKNTSNFYILENESYILFDEHWWNIFLQNKKNRRKRFWWKLVIYRLGISSIYLSILFKYEKKKNQTYYPQEVMKV